MVIPGLAGAAELLEEGAGCDVEVVSTVGEGAVDGECELAGHMRCQTLSAPE
jgi:hypothetical protein